MTTERTYTLREPAGGGSPVLVEVPHASLALCATAARYITASREQIARAADLYVDEIFADTPAQGATLLVAGASRCLVDLNRAEEDIDAQAVDGGPIANRPRGVIWRLGLHGEPLLRRPLPRTEYLRRLDAYYRPYHRALRRHLAQKHAQFGLALLLSAHSMPTPNGHDSGAPPADLVVGTRQGTSAAGEWIDLVDSTARERGWLVRHDVPYRGGHITGHYGRPTQGCHAVQIEIARRLYMDEESLTRQPASFGSVRAFARELVSRCVGQAASRSRTRAGVT